MMSADQRARIRTLFGELDVTIARDQFAVVKDLTGTTITSVAELTAATAHRLIKRLAARVRDGSKTRTETPATSRSVRKQPNANGIRAKSGQNYGH